MTQELRILERWTRAVVRFRLAVLLCWLLIAAAGALAATRLPALLTTSLVVPGTSSARADATLARHFGENPEGTFTVVFQTHDTRPATINRLARRLARAAAVVPGGHATPLRSGAGITYGNVVTRLDLQYSERYVPDVRRVLAAPGIPSAYVTGPPGLQYDLSAVLADDLRRGEAIAIPIALLVLVLALGFRPVLLVPLVFACCTISTSLGIVYLLAHRLLMVSYVPNFVELVGLGLAIDYSLLFAHRFREEVADERGTVPDAVVRTVQTAGRSVVFSGAAVAIALSAVLIMPVPFIRSMGVAGVIVPLVSIAAALTVQPALLSLLGRNGVRTPHASRESGSEMDGFWAILGPTVIRRRVPILIGATAVLAALAAPAIRLQLTPGSLSSVPQSTESGQGLALLRNEVGPGVITPIQVVLDSGARGRARTPAMSAATLRLADRVLNDPQVFIAAIGPRFPYVDAGGRFRRVIVYPRREFGDVQTQRLVDRLRRRLILAAHLPIGVSATTGGAPSEGVDFLSRVYGTFPWIVALVLLLAYLVLLRAFRSLVLPLLAVILDLVSVAATYGMLVLIFQLGVGARVLGLYQAPAIEGWIPVFLFATLFGLSMDYEVFLVTRMREAWDSGTGSSDAITYGLHRTGRIVSAAAVIMVASFSGFMVGRVAGLQELGTGLALGVLIDATLVRMLLLPSLMAVAGPRCWWLPAAVARLAKVEASPLAEGERRGPRTTV